MRKIKDVLRLKFETDLTIRRIARCCHASRSTIVTAQIPVDHWHEIIGDATLADAILDRLVHNAYRINLKGESMRKRYAKLTTTAPSE